MEREIENTYFISLLCYHTRIKNKTSLLSFPDLILDVHWLHSNNGKSNYEVAIATAHNAVWYFNMETGIKSQVAQCEENSILYPSTYFFSALYIYRVNYIIVTSLLFQQSTYISHLLYSTHHYSPN